MTSLLYIILALSLNISKSWTLPISAIDPDKLILTPLLQENKITLARSLSRVKHEVFWNVTSYSGYFTVDEIYDSNMFFWFFPSEDNYINDPVVLWLQGGPGWPSLDGLFTENGPFIITEDGETQLREHSWTKNHSVIYIDNPVGCGFSYTSNGYAENQTKVGTDLYNALEQFFIMFPELQKNEFYISGESYAGKYVPAIGYRIHKNNPTAKTRINLKGLLIGNGFSDPVNQMGYGEYLYQIGLADLNQKGEIERYASKIVKLINKLRFLKATNVFSDLIFGSATNTPTLFKNITGFSTYYNYLQPVDTNDYYWVYFVNRTDIRKAIHVGQSTLDDPLVEKKLWRDICRSVAPWISELLSNYRLLVYSGQLDIIVAYPLTVNYLKKLSFSGSDEYKTAQRRIWKVQDTIAGYGKSAGNLTEVLVRNSGHMVPRDQPEWAYDLVFRFTRNISLVG